MFHYQSRRLCSYSIPSNLCPRSGAVYWPSSSQQHPRMRPCTAKLPVIRFLTECPQTIRAVRPLHLTVTRTALEILVLQDRVKLQVNQCLSPLVRWPLLEMDTVTMCHTLVDKIDPVLTSLEVHQVKKVGCRSPVHHVASAKSLLSDTKHVPCKFFRNGACTAGESCPYSHSMDPLEPCKFFLAVSLQVQRAQSYPH